MVIHKFIFIYFILLK